LFKNTTLPTAPYFSISDESLKKPIVLEIISANVATIINTFVPGHVTSAGSLCLRPTFLTKCQPDPSLTANASSGQYFTNDVCTGELESTEFQGFPSGHSTTAFGGWVFFILYINGKAKVLILCLPLLFASWVSITRINDFSHFPFQVITGVILGIFSGLISYRLHFGNSDWFIGNGNYLDHIPAHYKFIEDWNSEDEDEERGNSRNGNVAREAHGNTLNSKDQNAIQ
ncbi:12118_t:CDS:2, partial [Entrophospora sp. SA101]